MTEIDGSAEPLDGRGERVDGRVARRQRNIDAVLDVVMEMFAEEAMFPTIEQVATRSGLSLRSLYRYFADPGELLEATFARTARLGRDLSQLPNVGQGSLDGRIDDFVAMRLRLHDGIGPVYRASLANAAHHRRVRDRLAANRVVMREQFELQFAPELGVRKGRDREALVTAGDLLTQLESIDFLRRHRQLPVDEVRRALTSSLRSLLG